MSWSLCFPSILLFISALSMMIEYFKIKIPYIQLLPMLLNDTTGFLSVVCLIGLIAAVWKYRNEKNLLVWPAILYILDLVLVNKLYLNTTWPRLVQGVLEIFALIASWNWPIILVSAFCLIIVAVAFVWGMQLWKENSRKKNKNRTAFTSHSAPVTGTAQSGTKGTETPPHEYETVGDPSNSQDGNPKFTDKVSSDPNSTSDFENRYGGPSMVHFGLCVLLIIPVISAIQFVFYRLLPLKLDVPDILNRSLDTLIYISTICAGLIVILTVWLGIKRMYADKQVMRPRLPAVLAFLLELIFFILFFFNINAIAPDFLDKFLTSITNNTLIALLIIPIVLFVILDVVISLFLTAFFNGFMDDKRGWPQKVSQKLDDIQQRIVMFVLNMIIGILNLFLFIPDFFNEIGELLLSKDDIFPQFKESDPNPASPKGTGKSDGQKKE